MTSLLINQENPENEDDIPDCLKFEYMILGKIVADNSLLDSIDFLKADHFLDRYHAEIFDRMHDLRNLEEIIQPESLAPFIDMPGGVMRYLKRSVVDSFMADDAIAVARQVVEFAKRRQLQKFLQEMAMQLNGHHKMSHEIISKIQTEIIKIGSESGIVRFSTNKEVGARILRNMEKLERPYTTGIRALDKAMDGGMYPGKCYLFGGRKKMGKTTLSGTISCNMNTADIPHLYVNAEMSAEEIEQRNLARLTDSYASSFRNDYGRTDGFRTKITEKIDEINNSIIYLDAPGIPFDDLKNAVAQAVVRFGIKVFILDCLQLVGGKPNRKSQAEHQDDVGQWCATYAREKNLVSIVTAQINQTGNIRGGEGVRMACDQAFEIHAPEDDPSRSDRWLEMIETRYTAWMDVGSKDASVLLMSDNGPFIYERDFTLQEPMEFIKP